jgi:hypothetical protein
VIDAERTAADAVAGIRGSGVSSSAVGAGGPGEHHVREGTDNAVFRRGTGIHIEVLAGARDVGVAVAVTCTAAAVVGAVERAVGVERGFCADVATDLDAGVGARDVVETRTIQGANPHVLDRFGLDGKISCLCPTHGDETRR